MSTNDEYKENNFIKYLFQWSSCFFLSTRLNVFTVKIDFIDYQVPNVSKMYYEGKDSTIVQKGCSPLRYSLDTIYINRTEQTRRKEVGSRKVH